MGRRRNVIISSLAVSTFFMVLWFPYQAIFFLHAIQIPSLDVDIDKDYFYYCRLIGYLTCALNPFFYTFLNANYRRAFAKVVRSIFSRSDDSFSITGPSTQTLDTNNDNETLS